MPYDDLENVVFMEQLPLFEMTCTCMMAPAGFFCQITSIVVDEGESITGTRAKPGEDLPLVCPIFVSIPNPTNKKALPSPLVQTPFYNIPMDFIPNVDALEVMKDAYQKHCKCGS